MVSANRTSPPRLVLPLMLMLLTGISCGAGAGGQAPVVQPGAPGQESRAISPAQSAAALEPRHTAADIMFMQGMIHHHAQALDMTALLATRTNSENMKKLALRIALSQEDEITMMREWLAERGADVPGEHAHHAPGAPLMPGMLTDADMARLAAAKGVEFDRLFLEYMITHHEGALVMVKELFSTPGAGQEGEIFAFASDVDADQLIEIRRMGLMLKELQK
jgi:uncharacterized protein (DUF305 family)